MNLRLSTCLLSTIISFYTQFTYASEVTQLDDVVVTATRTAQTIDDSLAAVTVIDRKEIERNQSLTLPELLRTINGLDIVSTGGLGKVASMLIRGTETDHVLVLIDGMKIGSSTLGTVSFQDIPLAHIERIEIVKGPRSSLYGSEAIGGVIHIFTRQGISQAYASIGAGTQQTYQATGGWSDKVGNLWAGLHANYLNTEGFNTCEGNLTAGCFTIEPDKDSYENTAFSGRIGYQLDDVTRVEATALRIQAENQYDSFFNNESDILQQVLGITMNTRVQNFWEVNVNIGQNLDELDNFGNVPTTYFNQNRNLFSWQNNFLLDNAVFTVGYDYQKDKITGSTTEYTITSRDNHGIFAEYQTQFDPVNVVVGLRHDKNQQFGTHNTGNVSLGYSIDPNWQFFVAYGTAFKAPSFNQLYYPDYGNPMMKPEKAESVELGITAQHAQNHLTFQAYRSRVDDMIGGYPIENFDKAHITGAEITEKWLSPAWELVAQLSWLNAENELTQKKLPYRAEYKAYFAITNTIGQARFTVNFLTQSYRFDDVNNTQRLSGYGIFNAHSEYQYDKNWVIRLRLDNVFARDYQTIRAYDMPTRTMFLQLEYTAP